MRSLNVSLVLFALALATGCGPIGIGGECYYTLSESGCVEGGFCTPVRTGPVGMGREARWDTAVCRTVCEAPGDCGVGEECRAVPGREAFLTCQPIVETP